MHESRADTTIDAERVAHAFEDEGRARELLVRAGEPEPERALRALERTRDLPELASAHGLWAADVVTSAGPALALECLCDVAEDLRARGAERLDLRRLPGLARVLGASPFLARLLRREPGLLPELEAAAGDDLPAAPCPGAPAPEWEAIRRAKYAGLLRVTARDLLGRDPRAGLRELSDLADDCLTGALECAALETGIAPASLLALGKLGGRELNFSSDVDVLFVYEAPPGEEGMHRNREVQQLVRAFRAGLEGRGPLGFGYRVDLDLRPEGTTGALANSVDGALGYYETFGAEWERQALIRLRPVAGPAADAERFVSGVTPFVYRRAISPQALHDVRDMKLRIEAERRGAGRDLDHDLKEGPGGIRDVEFLAQALQLLIGGREPAVRTGNVPDALEALAAAGALARDVASSLVSAYLWLRRAENALQQAEERQTQAFPRRGPDQLGQARRMGYAHPDGDAARAALLDDWTQVRAEVRAHFEALLPEADA